MKITGFNLVHYNSTGYPATGMPAYTKITVTLDMEEEISVVYPLNPDLETFEKISLEFIRRVMDGNINQRKKEVHGD